MPDKEFLETFPLYRKFKIDHFPQVVHLIKKANIKMFCPNCNSNQTYLMQNEYWDNVNKHLNPGGQSFQLVYTCTHCQEFKRFFFIRSSPNDIQNEYWYMKIGQYPAWDISGDPQIEKLLGKHSDYYKKGLICESQGYGIGAYSYYRRIVELIIDELLDKIKNLLSGDELGKYTIALEKTKKTKITDEKIKLVKDLLPPILRPDNMNPLSILHSTLSRGLHAESDSDCLDLAEQCRDILSFLVRQVAESKIAADNFTTSMRKLLEKKSEKENL